jgi:hypothetical protein
MGHAAGGVIWLTAAAGVFCSPPGRVDRLGGAIVECWKNVPLSNAVRLQMANDRERAARELERDAQAAHEQRVAQIADLVRRIPDADVRANAARALRKLKSDPDAVRALIDLLAIATWPRSLGNRNLAAAQAADGAQGWFLTQGSRSAAQGRLGKRHRP